jgi:hypothetical protein
VIFTDSPLNELAISVNPVSIARTDRNQIDKLAAIRQKQVDFVMFAVAVNANNLATDTVKHSIVVTQSFVHFNPPKLIGSGFVVWLVRLG